MCTPAPPWISFTLWLSSGVGGGKGGNERRDITVKDTDKGIPLVVRVEQAYEGEGMRERVRVGERG